MDAFLLGHCPPRAVQPRDAPAAPAVPAVQDEWLEDLNPESLVVVKGAYATPELAKAQPGGR